MDFIDYFEVEDKEFWKQEIKKSDWGAGQFLYELLENNQLLKLVGESTKVLMLVEGQTLISFCTLAEQDDVTAPLLTPWIGFVYTFPEFRGKGYMGELLAYAKDIAKSNEAKQIYISTNHTGLYEKYGYSFYKMMKDNEGEDSRVYRIEIK